METLTYHQVLADMYEDTSKNILVNDHEYEEDVGPKEHHSDELENQEEFQKEQPSHQVTYLNHNPTDYSDRTKLGVRYHKHIKTHVINIDSRFRYFYSGIDASTQILTPSEFNYNLPIPIKNAISVRLSSIEIPNAFYSFSRSRGNTSFYLIIPSGSKNPLNKRLIEIPDGNYDDIGLCSAVEQKLNNAVSSIVNTLGVDSLQGTPAFSVLVDGGNATLVNSNTFNITGKITITTNAINAIFDLIFDADINGKRDLDYGLGHYLGFKTKKIVGSFSYTGDGIVDVTDWPYIFLSLHPDWKIVKHQNSETNSIFSFAKILLNGTKNTMIFSNASNTITSEYFFPQPTNILSFPVKLSDPYDVVLDLVGMDFSLTLEIIEVLNASLYETMREH